MGLFRTVTRDETQREEEEKREDAILRWKGETVNMEKRKEEKERAEREKARNKKDSGPRDSVLEDEDGVGVSG